ncbi:MAG: polyphosphate polymerase domain-containing protein [Anaerolineae bacterium]|jgi:SPX domain protein involved in polyphosphate accumulation
MTVTIGTPRYEVKIPTEPYRLHEIETWLRLHPTHWRVAYPPRQVNNIYFDTTDYRCLHDNLSGVGQRSKLRLRWYGPALDVVTGPRLELKRREGNVGWKEIYPLDITLRLTHTAWADLRRQLRAAATGRPALLLARFGHPALINTYQRRYYVAPDGRVRLTLDTDLRAYSQRFSGRPNLRQRAVTEDRVIIELKAPADDVSFQALTDALARFPLRPDRHSKFVHGMLAAPDFDEVFLP